jgi:hypothetical protein
VAGCIVEEQQDLLACHVIAPPPGPGVQAGRDLCRGDPSGQQQAGQRVGRADRPLAGGVAVQRQEELPVRKGPGQPVRGVHRESGLADPGHPIDRVDPHHPVICRGQRPHQLREFGLPAGEGGDVARQGPGCRRRERRRRWSLPGGQHLSRGGLAAGRGHKQLTRRPGQAQRPGQQGAGVLAGGSGDPHRAGNDLRKQYAGPASLATFRRPEPLGSRSPACCGPAENLPSRGRLQDPSLGPRPPRGRPARAIL